MRLAAAVLVAGSFFALAPAHAADSKASPAASSTPAATASPVSTAPPLGVVTPIPDTGADMAGFVEMIDQRIEARRSPEEVAKIDAAIKAKYEKPMAVMITDMTGMTSQTKKSGIVAFFTAIREMQRTAVPAIQKNGAKWIKIDADDLFVIHSSPKALFQTAKDIQTELAKFNKAEGQSMGLAIGLSYGPTLVIGDEELWGDSVNVASKLGEDTAEAGEILVSEEFLTALKNEGAKADCKQVTAKERKLKFPYYSCK